MNHKKRNIIVLIIAVIVLVILLERPYVGVFNALFGLMIGGGFFFISYILKFGGEEKLPLKEAMLFIVPYVFLATMSIWTWYGSLILLDRGIARNGVIKSIAMRWEGGGEDAPLRPHYYSTLDNFNHEIECNKSNKVGDTISYLYSPELYTDYGDMPAIMMQPGDNVSETVFAAFGSILSGTVVYAICFSLAWFMSLLKRGIVLLKERLAKEKTTISKFRYTILFLLSYTTFVVFVPAFFKNIFLLCNGRFLYMVVTTFSLLVILLSDWGERLFEYSANLMLELKSYSITTWFKHIGKVIGFTAFCYLLFQSLVQKDKSVFDIIAEFLKLHFNLNLKAISDLVSGVLSGKFRY